MIKHRKIIVILFTMLCVAGTVFAGAQQEAAAGTDKPSGVVKFVNVWGGSRVELMGTIISDFEKENPGITVESEIIPQDGMNERYLTSIASGTAPDVIMLKRDHLPYFASQNALLAMDPYLEREGMNVEEIFYEAEAMLCKWNGKTYALPNSTATGWALLFWNKKMFREAGFDPEKPPKTWEELTEMNKKFLEKQNGNVRSTGLPPDISAGSFYTTWLGANNGRLLSEDKKKVMIDSPEAKETLTWLMSEIELLGGIEKVQEFYEYAAPTGGSPPRIAFYNSLSALMLEGVWMFYQIAVEAPEGFEYGTGLLPFNGSNKEAKSSVLVDGGWGYSIPRNAKNPNAAWEWVKYSCAGEGSKDFFQGQNGRPTPIQAINKDQWYYDNNEYWDVVIADAENATYSPPLPVSVEIKQAINTEIEPVLYGRRSIDEGLKAAQSAAQQILDEYWEQQ